MNRLKSFLQSYRVPKDGKVSDKTFLHSITVSILSILLCMVILSSVTWAWFSESTSSSSNTITAANYELTITVKNSSEGPQKAVGEVLTFTATEGSTYEITLTATGSASTGFCVITVNGQEYYTDQIFTQATQTTDTEGSTSPKLTKASFTLSFTKETQVTLTPRWGSYVAKDDWKYFKNKEKYKDCILIKETENNS